MGTRPEPRSGRLPGLLLALAGVLMAAPAGAVEIRAIDGSGNNLANPDWGTPGIELLRLTPPAYDDGVGVPRGGGTLPSPRAISNAVAAEGSPLDFTVTLSNAAKAATTLTGVEITSAHGQAMTSNTSER